MDQKFNFKRIADPVHGTIGLSKKEVNILNAKAFQRLRRIKHLGLADYVYPGANYSRLSHCIGTCHISGQILEVIQKEAGLKKKDIQEYRLAALMHDIGHYPFSHPFEEALKRTEKKLEDKSKKKIIKHEQVGKEILLRDRDIKNVIKDSDMRLRIAQLFTKEYPLPINNLISSDLDADRLDYLLRTAHHTSLPYGTTDLKYIISQMKLDNENRLCISSKAVRSAEHFLLSRYFDYVQITYHKTIVALEHILIDLIANMLQTEFLDASKEKIITKIESGEWYDFDDNNILNKIRLFSEENGEEHIKIKAKSLIARTAPKLLGEIEFIDKRDDEGVKRHYENYRSQLAEKMKQICDYYGINQEYYFLWDIPGLVLTSIGSRINISSLEKKSMEDEERIQNVIRIVDSNTKTSRMIHELRYSILKNLSEYALYTIRVYLLLPNIKAQKKRMEIERKLKSELPNLPWKNCVSDL